jgi:hypothetical protein
MRQHASLAHAQRACQRCGALYRPAGDRGHAGHCSPTCYLRTHFGAWAEGLADEVLSQLDQDVYRPLAAVRDKISRADVLATMRQTALLVEAGRLDLGVLL